MHNLTSHLSRSFYLLALLLLPLFSNITMDGYAQDVVQAEELNPKQSTPNDYYSYIIEGRSDPFKPFISPKAATPAGVDPNEIVDENSELSGMQLFEPGQLTLVAVMLSDTDEIAMVEDQTKKGYILKEGDLIGKRGVVTQIDKQQVVITETAHTRAGKAINSSIIMRLNKEGDN
jgi:type IV pilus assembly protein PilP